MLKETLPPALEEIFTKYSEPEAVFAALLPAVCEFLQTDRCFLQVRHPHNRLYRVFCWCRSPQFPDLSIDVWQQEEHWEQDDPMFAAALRSSPSIFVEDVETTAPEVLNVNFERENFGHRALIHAHICQDDLLWGILQPCIFRHPRVWSEGDRALVTQVIERVKPFVISYATLADVVAPTYSDRR